MEGCRRGDCGGLYFGAWDRPSGSGGGAFRIEHEQEQERWCLISKTSGKPNSAPIFTMADEGWEGEWQVSGDHLVKAALDLVNKLRRKRVLCANIQTKVVSA